MGISPQVLTETLYAIHMQGKPFPDEVYLITSVNAKAKAIEWLFAQAFGRKFRVSLDNLTGEGGDGTSFKDRVFTQVQAYFSGEAKLPSDAAYFIQCICSCSRDCKI